MSLPKPGRDRTNPSGYRPISLTNTGARILEAIVHRRLYFYAETLGVLPETQFAFRKGRSHYDPLIILTQDIKHGFTSRYHSETVMVQLDITKAFDTVWLDGLRHKLHTYGIRGNLLRFLSSFIADRRYRVVTPDTTEYTEFDNGVPQGSCFSPLLFTLFPADCGQRLKCQHAEFADEFTLWSTAQDRRTAEAELQHDLEVIERFAKRWHITFGEKCSYTVFYERAPRDRGIINADLQFWGSSLSQEPEPRLLGIHFDHSLCYTAHIRHIERDVQMKMAILRRLIRGRLGSNRGALLSIYKGWIRPKLENGSMLFASVSLTARERLERLQNAALRLVLWASRNTPGPVLTTECQTSTLAYRRDLAVLKRLRKIQSLPPGRTLHTRNLRWNSEEVGFEPKDRSPAHVYSFFGYANSIFWKYFGRSPYQEIVQTAPLFPPRPWLPHVDDSDPHGDYRCQLRQKVREHQQRDFETAPSISFYRGLRPSYKPSWPHAYIIGSRQLSSVIFRIRSGYCRVGRMRHFGPPIPCPGCRGEDSPAHLLLDCPAYAEKRRELIDVVRKEAPDRQLTLQLLIGYTPTLRRGSNLKIATAVAKFIVRTGRKI